MGAGIAFGRFRNILITIFVIKNVRSVFVIRLIPDYPCDYAPGIQAPA